MLDDQETPAAPAPPAPAAQQYRLDGLQVEPEASSWARCPVLSTVSREAIFKRLNPPGSVSQVQHYPLRASVQAQNDLLLIRTRFNNRYDLYPPAQLSDFLKQERYIASPPYGAVIHQRPAPTPFIKTGAELASLFEDETPGLWHRHVLNVLLNSPISQVTIPPRLGADNRLLRLVLSPPRQALIWHALETAISSALMAAWHYKWFAHGFGLARVAYRERPWEADNTLPVLYDYEVDHSPVGSIDEGDIKRDVLKPGLAPGTPRHPAYSSGHSTYAAAASYVLACLLPERHRRNFELLAENIGQARIWGGVHWTSDHTFGLQLGNVVGRLVIEQLNKTHISPCPAVGVTAPPPWTTIRTQAVAFSNQCDEDGGADFCRDCSYLPRPVLSQ